MNSMELLIIRHGQSEADLLGVHEGRADFPLTEQGISQATKMAKKVAKGYAPSIILASPLKRASKTAQILQKEVGCELQYFDDLMEYNNGVLAGMDREEAAIKYPLPAGGRPAHIAIEGGESELDFRYRAEKMLQIILSEYAQFNRVAIISHGGFISHFIQALLQDGSHKLVIATGDTGMHLITIKNDMKVVRFLNNQSHLYEYQ